MNTYYLPKTFDLDINAPFCCDHQLGKNQTSPHWHSGIEIIFMVKGEAEVWFNNSWHKLDQSSMLFIPQGQLHCCRCTDPYAEKIVMGFTEGCFDKNSIPFALPAEINNHCIFRDLEHSQIPEWLNSFESHCIKKDRCAEYLLAKSDIFRIYAYILNSWENSGISVNNKSHNSSTEIYNYIEKHFTENISPYTAAKHLNMSYSSLAKKMKLLEEDSFIKCVNRLRIENAKKLLAITEKSITEISFECGFSTTSYFIKIFRELTGMTPKVYRSLVNK